MKANELSANELRLGNYFTDSVFLCKVITISNKAITGEVIEVSNHKIARGEDYYNGGVEYSFNFENINSIPLTEEWLIKFGFDKFSSTQYDRDNFWAIQIQERGSHTGEYYCNQLECYIKYVHQLQNLYFALTGEELTIKES